MNHKTTWSALLKKFFPNWKFFAQISPHYQFYFQDLSTGAEQAPWQEIKTTLNRKDLSLWRNEIINLQHALNSVIDRWIQITQQVDFQTNNLDNFPEYKILTGFIMNHLDESTVQFKKIKFTFKIEMNSEVLFQTTHQETLP